MFNFNSVRSLQNQHPLVEINIENEEIIVRKCYCNVSEVSIQYPAKYKNCRFNALGKEVRLFANNLYISSYSIKLTQFY